jgi:hypothetical protein
MESFTPAQQLKLTIATTASVAIVILLMSFVYWDVQQDDSYIFYSYAQNIVNGQGYVFNLGERVNATTSPLYTLLLSGGYLLFRFLSFVTIPLIGHAISAISLFILCIFLMGTFSSEKDTVYPFVLPLVFLTIPLIPPAIGMETFLALMLAMMCIYFYVRGRLLAASLACSCAVLARPDMVLLAGIMVSYDFIRYRRFPAIKMMIVFLSPVLVWLTFSLVYFGDPLPTSLAAKLAQTEAGLWGSGPVFFNELWTVFLWFGMTVPRTILVVLLVLGLILLLLKIKQWSLFRHPAFHLILLWNLLYLLVYGAVLNAPGYGWYYTPLALGISLLVTLPLEGLYRLFAKTPALRNHVLIPVVYCFLILVGLGIPWIMPVAPVKAKYDTYKLAAEWLSENTQPGSSVGAGDIGVLRFYYKHGPVIDAAGLVNPEVIDHLRNREFSWFIRHYEPDYLMFNHPPRRPLNEIVKDEWFRQEYFVDEIVITPSDRVAIYQRIKQ